MDISSSEDKKRPNVIVVLTDGMRPRDLSLYGYHKETDKRMKEIIRDSTIFMNAFSTSGASDTADTSIFTGKFPTTSGFIHQNPRTEDIEIERLKKCTFWLPSYLQKLGYATISITPQHKWFKIGYDICMTKEGEGIGKYLNVDWFRIIMLALPNWLYKFGKRWTSIRTSPPFSDAKEVVNDAIKTIEDLDKEETGKPFYFYMQLLDAHCPYAGVDTPDISGEETVSKVLENIEGSYQKEYVKKRFVDSQTNSMEQSKAKLDDATAFMDREIGRLVDYLKEKDKWNNTVLIIISDHGENYGEHGNYFCRGGLYEPSIHIPLIMHLPGLPARKIDSLISNVDVSATVLDYLGDNKKIDGRSLLPLIKGEFEDDNSFRDKIIMADGFCKDRFAVRTKDRKLIISEDGICYLCGMKHDREKYEEYDLENDPDELNNIYKGSSELQEYLESEMDKVRIEVKEGVVPEVVGVK
jgi:arylsulfatase